MKIRISTQVTELYGDRWKAKGGHNYIIANVPLELLIQGYTEINAHVETATLGMFSTYKEGDEYQEWIIDWSIEEDDSLSYEEQLQLEYDGKITYPDKVILDHKPPEEVF